MKLSIILSQLSTGMAGTISIFVLTLVFSLPLGLLIAFGRMSKNRIVSGIFRLYISLMRGTPLMLQLMVVYFGPFYLFGMNIGKWRFPAIITGFALNYGAYFAEIYRSGIVSMDRVPGIVGQGGPELPGGLGGVRQGGHQKYHRVAQYQHPPQGDGVLDPQSRRRQEQAHPGGHGEDEHPAVDGRDLPGQDLEVQ